MINIIANIIGGGSGSGGGSVTPLELSVIHDYGFITDVTWSGGELDYELQRSFYSDYSDAVTIYSGNNLSYHDTESVFTGHCFYRVRSNAGAWVGDSINVVISDTTIDTRVCFVGDSIVQGQSASPTSLGFANLFYRIKGWTQQATGDSRGLPGNAITPEASPPYTLWDYDSGVNIMAPKTPERNYLINPFGINDGASTPSMSNATPENFRVALEVWVDYAISVGWPLGRIIIMGPWDSPTNRTRLQTFRDAARTAASNKGVGFISGMDFQVANGLTPPDNVHPSTSQHLLMSRWLADRVGNPGLAPTYPTIISVVITAPTVILISFNTVVDATNVGWSFKKNGSDNNPTAISGSGTKTLRFTIPSIAAGDSVTYSYNPTTGDTSSYEKAYSVELPIITDHPVTNQIPASYDVDAQALFTAIEGTGETLTNDEKSGYNNFILGLKSNNIWSVKTKAFWTLGTSLNKCKFNFRDPQDANGSFRLSQTGTVTYASDGVSGGAAGNHLNTNFNPTSNASFQNSLAFYFSQFGTTEGALAAMGSLTSAAQGHYALIPCLSTNFSAVFNNSAGFITKNNPSPKGRYVVSRTSSTGWTCYKNGLSLYSPTTTSVTPHNANITICGCYLASANKISTGGIFDGLTSSEVAALDALVKTLEYTLNRI
jgi:lysophospholipase L1-like esterase